MMTSRSLAPAAVLVAAVCSSTAPAHATTIIGFGNAIFNNTCIDSSGVAAGGHVERDSGTVGGNGLRLPISAPGNGCGDAGPEAVHNFMGSDH